MFRFAGAAARLVLAALAMLSLATPATAQYLTFVSATGNDANNCLVQASPCKTLQRAINVTTARGEVRLLSRLVSTGFINKSITIDGAGNTLIGAITIGSATAAVTLRGLNLDGVGGYVNGIRIDSAAAVHIEDSTVERYAGDGIRLITTAATKLFVVNTVSRGNLNSSDGLHIEASNAQVVIENSRFDQNGYTGAYLNVPNVSVTGSSASGNGLHGFVLGGQRAKITETSADHNSGDGFAVRASSVYLTSAETIGNGAFGLHVELNQTAIIDRCKFLKSSSADSWAIRNEGILYSLKNNVWDSIYGAGSLSWAPQ